MSTIAAGAHATRAPMPLSALQSHFTGLVDSSSVIDILRSCLRHLPEADTEDRIQEGLASGWRAFKNKAKRMGELLEERNIIWIAKRTALDLKRRLVGGDDVRCCLAPTNSTTRGLYVERMAGAPAVPLEVREDVRRHMAHALPAEREIVKGYVAGDTLSELGERIGISGSGAARRLDALPHRLRRRMAKAASGQRARLRRPGRASHPSGAPR